MIGIDMPMPEKCWECPMLKFSITYQDDVYFCGAKGFAISIPHKKPAICPLIDMSQYEDDRK